MTISRLTIPFLFIAILTLWGSFASAHVALTSQEQMLGNYKITFEGSADTEVLYERYAISYLFRLLDASGSDVPYDYALISFTTRDDLPIFSVQTAGSHDFVPGAMMDASMPIAGDYTADVIFVNELANGESKELAKASFDFSAKPNPSIATVNQNDNPASENNSNAPLLAWVIGSLIIGALAGRYGSNLFKD